MTAPIILAKLTPAQQDCVDILEEVLAEARKGNINTLGIIACMKKGYAHTMCGSNASDLNLGLDSLKQAVLKAVEKPVKFLA